MSLGKEKLEVVELLQALVQLHDESICKRMRELKVPELLLRMMHLYWSNTFLHKMVYDIFHEAIKSKLHCFIQTVSFASSS
jgi:hypothetical protein